MLRLAHGLTCRSVKHPARKLPHSTCAVIDKTAARHRTCWSGYDPVDAHRLASPRMPRVSDLNIAENRGIVGVLSFTYIIMSTATVPSAMSRRHNVMPDMIMRCWRSGTRSISEPVSATHGAGAGRPATGRRSRSSHSTQSATALSRRGCHLRSFLVRSAVLLPRPDLVTHRPRRATKVMGGAEPPAASRSFPRRASRGSPGPSPQLAPWHAHSPEEAPFKHQDNQNSLQKPSVNYVDTHRTRQGLAPDVNRNGGNQSAHQRLSNRRPTVPSPALHGYITQLGSLHTHAG